MIALGITPGIRSLGYCVLQVNQNRRAELVDTDVLHAGRRTPAHDAADVARRTRSHHLILDVVLRRNPPAVIALGPSADAKEPPEHVGLVRLGLVALGSALAVRVVDLGSQEAILEALSTTTSKGLATRLRTVIVGGNAVPRDRRLLLATAAAVAGALAAGADLR